MICDKSAFDQMDPNPEKNADLQTIQIAHEYYGLAGIEKNIGSDSDYWLSNQLQAHMGYERVRKIVVGVAPNQPAAVFKKYSGEIPGLDGESRKVKLFLIVKENNSATPSSSASVNATLDFEVFMITFEGKENGQSLTLHSKSSGYEPMNYLSCAYDANGALGCKLIVARGEFSFKLTPDLE